MGRGPASEHGAWHSDWLIRSGYVMVSTMKQPLHGFRSHGGRAGIDFTLEWDRMGNYQKELSREGRDLIHPLKRSL